MKGSVVGPNYIWATVGGQRIALAFERITPKNRQFVAQRVDSGRIPATLRKPL